MGMVIGVKFYAGSPFASVNNVVVDGAFGASDGLFSDYNYGASNPYFVCTSVDCSSTYRICRVAKGGNVGAFQVDEGSDRALGCRPVVCIPSSVELTVGENQFNGILNWTGICFYWLNNRSF